MNSELLRSLGHKVTKILQVTKSQSYKRWEIMSENKIKVVKFNQDFKKLDLSEFATLRKDSNKFTKGRVYRIKSPNHDYLAECTHITAEYLKNVCDEFLIKDTDTESREEAIDLLKSFYPDITEESVILGVFFKKVE